MGRALIVCRLALRDMRRRPVQSALLLLVIASRRRRGRRDRPSGGDDGQAGELPGARTDTLEAW